MQTNIYKVTINALSLAAILVIASCGNGDKESDAYGNFETTEIIVSSEIPGKIIYLDLEEGQELDSGAVIGLIDTMDFHLKKLQLIAQRNAIASKSSGVFSQIDVQNQQKQNLLSDRERLEKLYKDGAATKKQLDDIDAGINVIDKQILAIETMNSSVINEMTAVDRQIDIVEENLRKCKIINPVKGSVLIKYAESGEISIPGKALYKIADISEMILRIYVSGNQLPDIKTGQVVKVIVDQGDSEYKQLEGTITWISSSAEFTPKIIQTREERLNLVYAVKVRVKNDGSIKIGMPGEIRF